MHELAHIFDYDVKGVKDNSSLNKSELEEFFVYISGEFHFKLQGQLKSILPLLVRKTLI